MATSSGTKINALTVEKYEIIKKCDICCKEQPVGFEFLVVTCGCGCGEKKRSCEDCPAGSTPTCSGIKYKRLNKECTTS